MPTLSASMFRKGSNSVSIGSPDHGLGMSGAARATAASTTSRFQSTASNKASRSAYDGLSKEAQELLDIGRKKVGYIHERRKHHHDESKYADESDGSRRAGHGYVRTFVESLDLPQTVLEDVAHGHFVYLRPRPGFNANMYDLEPCSHAACDPNDYFTLSNAGVTHFQGVANSEFSDLAHFEREYRLFHAIMRIPFFKKQRVWKAFTGWKKGISGTKRSSASTKLTDGLFLLNPTLRTALMRLRKLCAEVSDYGLFSYDKAKTFALDEFVQAQNEKRVAITAWLTEFATEVRALVRSACDDVLDSFLAANNIQAHQKMTFMERAALRTACRRLTKFIRLADFLVRDTLMNLALDSTAQLQQAVCPPPDKMPPREVRTDLPVDESDPEAAAAAAVAKAAEARAKGGAKAIPAVPLFKVSVTFEEAGVGGAGPRVGRRSSIAGRRRSVDDSNARGGRRSSTSAPEPAKSATAVQEEKKDDSDASDSKAKEAEGPEPVLALTPSVSVVKTAMRGVLYDAMVVISAPPRLLSHPDLAPYTQAAEDEGADAAAAGGGSNEVDLTEVVTATAAYKACSNDIFAGLDAAFDAVDQFCGVFVPYGRTFLRNEQQLAGMDGTKYNGPMELSAFEAAISLYKGQISQFDDVPTFADIGIVKVESVVLKLRLIPSPTRCLQAIRDLLPSLMVSLTEKLIDEVRQMYNVLASTPTEVEPFVAKVEMLEKSQESLPALRDRETYIRSLATLMVDNQWPIADDLKAQFKMLKDTLADLEASTEKAGAGLEEDTKKFARQVEQAIPTLKKAVLGVREKMDESMIASADSQPAKVVKFIREQATRMEELKKQGVKFQHYQAMLKQNVSEFETVDEVGVLKSMFMITVVVARHCCRCATPSP